MANNKHKADNFADLVARLNAMSNMTPEEERASLMEAASSEPKVLEPGPNTLVIEFTTNDGQYHVDAYYEIKVKLIAP